MFKERIVIDDNTVYFDGHQVAYLFSDVSPSVKAEFTDLVLRRPDLNYNDGQLTLGLFEGDAKKKRAGAK